MRRGFTFIEVVIVVGIIALVLPLVFGIMLSILRQQARVYTLKQMKREGDTLLSVMENNIRNNAAGIYQDQSTITPLCNAAGSTGGDITPFYFKDTSGSFYFQYASSGNIVSYTSDEPGALTGELTSAQVSILNFKVTCQGISSVSPPLVSVDFNVQNNNGSPFPEDNPPVLHYQTQFILRHH